MGVESRVNISTRNEHVPHVESPKFVAFVVPLAKGQIRESDQARTREGRFGDAIGSH